MKPARIFPLFLLTLALLAPRMASAQAVDTFYISNDCGSDPGFDFGFVNEHPEFVNEIVLTLNPVDSIGFIGGSECCNAVGIWDNNVDSLGDSLVFFPLNGGGIGTGINDTGFFFLLGGLGGNAFPFDLFDHPVTLHWETLAGGQFVNQGTIVLIPTLFQGNCEFDSVSASATTVVCDPRFNFNVFNRNGLQQAISGMKFEIQGLTAGSIRPSDVQAPAGWTIDSVTEYDAYFSTSCGGNNQIPPGQNLNGFIVPLRANSLVTSFTWVWTAYSCGSTIDRDTILNVPATAQPCAENGSPDSLTIQNAGDCNFLINTEDYHNSTDTVSPVTSWTLTIVKPDSAKWSAAVLPPQAIAGTWQYSGVGTNTLNFHEVSKYLIDPAYAQPGGTIWTPRASIDNPDTGQLIFIQWSDSDLTTFLSSGIDTDSCSNGLSDTAWVVPGSGCDYTLIVENKHTNPSSSINAIAMNIPTSAGTFPLSCLSSSNKWTPTAPGSSARLTNEPGSSGPLTSGSFDTIHFCIDPAQTNSSWSLTWETIDANNNTLFSNVITVPGCVPPLVCDSIRHVSDTGLCSETITVLNLRQGGAEVDSVIVTPTAPWSIETAVAPLLWQATILPGNSSVLFTGTLNSGDSRQFVVSYNNGSSTSSTVEVATSSNGALCTNTAPVTCAASGVSPSSVPQTLAVSVVPNPMNQQADIILTTGSFDRVQMTLVDVLGRTSMTVLNSTIAAGDHDYTVDVSQLPPGTYYLRVVASGATLTKKLVVEH